MNNYTVSSFGEVLKGMRKQKNITQQHLAETLGVHSNTISKWERGICLPDSKGIVLEVTKLLHLNVQQTHQLLEASLTTLSPYWHVPYQRNPFFTGREKVLDQLHKALCFERTATLSQSYALSGLGGIGKTQTALEYAYRYANEYAAIFWVNAETREAIIHSFVALATMLSLPEKQDEEKAVAAVIRWLISHSGWLLIFDNIEDPAYVKPFLPPARSGALLFTTRRQSLGLTAQTLDLEQMTSEEGMSFLLHRTRLLHPTSPLDQRALTNQTIAKEIVAEMGGLPLALDQVGAYIDATQCCLSDYKQLLQSSQFRVLDERDTHVDHPLSVTKTFALAFEQLEQTNVLATKLLTVCAFLAPEAIPEEIFLEGAAHLGPPFEDLVIDPLQFHTAIKALLAYSLLQRNATTHTLTIHRLVQVVLKERLSEASQDIWTMRVRHALINLFPSAYKEEEIRVRDWPTCERFLSHAFIGITLGNRRTEDAVACITLTNHIAIYLWDHARFAEAEHLYQQALQMGQQALGLEHPLIAKILCGLGGVNTQQGKYTEAEQFYRQALHIREQALGPEHPDVGVLLSNLATLYKEQGHYEQAEPLYRQALWIFEHTLGPDDPYVAEPLTGLAILLSERKHYEQAELLHQRALALRQQCFGPQHPSVAETFYALAHLRQMQQRMTEALLLYQQALILYEQALGALHPKTCATRNAYTHLLQGRGQQEEVVMTKTQESECACGCGRKIDTSKSRGEPRRFFSGACKQRFYRNTLR